jgi:hypothetical protein
MQTIATTLPTVSLGAHRVTRLIIGGNPIRGYSHRDAEWDREMREYHTVENTVRTLLHCEACGLNTMQSRGDQVIYDTLAAYRRAGGTMHWIAQTAGEHPDPFRHIREVAARDPIAIYHHGSMSDRFWKDGTFGKVRDLLRAIRDTGKLVGIAAHIPEVLHYVEDHGWDVDFYMTCFYNLGKIERQSLLAGGQRVEEPFDDEDRPIICRFIQATAKPCIAYKILAASRKCETPAAVRQAFQYAFDQIKPGDLVNVGMFQKHGDQVAMNAELVRELAARD